MTRSAAARLLPGRISIAVAGLAATALLSGCAGASSSGSSPADVSSIQASARAQASAIASAGGGSVDPLAGQNEGGDNPVSSAEFCALMKKEVSKLSSQSKIQAMTSVVSDIADLYAAKHAMAKMDGSKMDELAKSCPGDSAKVLESAGVTAFSQL